MNKNNKVYALYHNNSIVCVFNNKKEAVLYRNKLMNKYNYSITELEIKEEDYNFCDYNYVKR